MAKISPMMGRDGQPIQAAHAEYCYYSEVSLGNRFNDFSMDLGSIRTVTAFTVVKLRGRAYLQNTGDDLLLREGETRDGLSMTSLLVGTLGYPDGVLGLEIHGRA